MHFEARMGAMSLLKDTDCAREGGTIREEPASTPASSTAECTVRWVKFAASLTIIYPISPSGGSIF